MFNSKKTKQKAPVTELIYKNCHVNTIYEACTCCYDNKKNYDYYEKKKYIEKRVQAGHESVLEHGRLAMKIKNLYDVNMIVDVTTAEYSKYLQFFTINETDGSYILIINGNMRSYKYFVNEVPMAEYDGNPIVRYIINLLEETTVKELYGNLSPDRNFFKFLDLEIDLTSNNCCSIDYGESLQYCYEYSTTVILDDNKIKTSPKVDKSIEIGYDDQLLNIIKSDPDIPEEIYGDIIPITIIFRNMSRTATHQLVRHRNAITQESQRYVNYSDASFTIPVPEYNNKEYKVKIFGTETTITLSELSNQLIAIYEQLQKAGLKKEEARAFLPSNVNCGKLYMTFSLNNLIAFKKLRCDEHAQYEIRQYALAIPDII